MFNYTTKINQLLKKYTDRYVMYVCIILNLLLCKVFVFAILPFCLLYTDVCSPICLHMNHQPAAREETDEIWNHTFLTSPDISKHSTIQIIKTLSGGVWGVNNVMLSAKCCFISFPSNIQYCASDTISKDEFKSGILYSLFRIENSTIITLIIIFALFINCLFTI